MLIRRHCGWGGVLGPSGTRPALPGLYAKDTALRTQPRDMEDPIMPLKQAEAHKKQYDTRILAMFGRSGDNAPYIKIPLAFSAGGAWGLYIMGTRSPEMGDGCPKGLKHSERWTQAFNGATRSTHHLGGTLRYSPLSTTNRGGPRTERSRQHLARQSTIDRLRPSRCRMSRAHEDKPTSHPGDCYPATQPTPAAAVPSRPGNALYFAAPSDSNARSTYIMYNIGGGGGTPRFLRRNSTPSVTQQGQSALSQVVAAQLRCAQP